MTLKIKIDEGVIDPTYAKAGDAGMDIRAFISEPYVLQPGDFHTFPTGVRLGTPDGVVCFVCRRSGLAQNHGVSVTGGVGVVDSGYRGELTVSLINNSQIPYKISPQERIAQLVFLPVVNLPIELVDSLDETERGESGFGSSGTH